MCDIAGIQSDIVPGYTRSEFYEIGTAGSLNHAWNVILLDSTYYYLDATWAAGGCSKNENGKLLKFYKNFDEYYWLTPTKDFLRDHFPKDAKWILQADFTREKFAANPYYKQDIISKLKLLSPNSGTLTPKVGDTLHFKLQYQFAIKKVQINTNIFRNPDIYYYEERGNRQIKHLILLPLKDNSISIIITLVTIFMNLITLFLIHLYITLTSSSIIKEL